MSAPARIVVVVGPTASGKSDLAVALARRLGSAEVVNADSMQLYRGMDVGTAKLPEAERGGVPHHLLDVLDVSEGASVAAFQRAARTSIEDCLARGVTPIVVGGSSLYVRAVIDRLDFPGTEPAVRARWAAELEARGAQALHRHLATVDPVAAARILPSNARRVVRALEVIEITGSPFAAELPEHASVYDDVVLIGLDVPRDVLDERISRRVDAMFDTGLVDEVRTLERLGLDDGPTASRALGYAQVLSMLRGEISEQEARDATVAATRRFARRQDRLFHQDPRVHWLAHDHAALVDAAVEVVTRP
jgi:tRNA dimethylallyltransferase